MIVLSYRCADSAGLTRALRERLVRELGPAQVFIDVDGIEGGAEFRKELLKVTASCDVLIVVIGPKWLTGDTGASRLGQADDVVRLEVANALRHGVRVLPVLVDGTPMPEKAALPEDVSALADRNALRLAHGSFEADVGRILEVVAMRRPALPAYGPLAGAAAGAVAYVLLAWRWPFYLAGLAVVATLVAVALFLAARTRLARSGSAARVLGVGLVAAAGALVFLGGGMARERRLTEPFALTVRVQDPGGHAVPEGTIHLTALNRSAEVANGEAAFPGLTERLVGQTLEVVAVADAHEPLTARVTIPVSHVVTLHMEPRHYATPVRGRVLDALGRALAGVHLDFNHGQTASTSDANGNFSLTVPLPPGTVLPLRATLGQIEGYNARITIPERTPLVVPFVPTS